MDCIFCKIINNEIPSYTIYEDDLLKVFLDINPSTNGDMLIVPKKHYSDGFELTDELILHINKVTKKLNQILIEKLSIDGMSCIVNYGIAQDIKHYHMHLTPRYKNDNLTHTFDKTILKELTEIHELLKEN